MIEEGKIEDALQAMGFTTDALHSYDDDEPHLRDAFRHGYTEGFAARVRKLAYPGRRVRGTLEES